MVSSPVWCQSQPKRRQRALSLGSGEEIRILNSNGEEIQNLNSNLKKRGKEKRGKAEDCGEIRAMCQCSGSRYR